MSKHPLIWIDLENTPHVPFFVPIVLDLERAGCEVILTARDFAQTKELVERAGLTARIIGGEYGNSSLIKTIGITFRAFALAWYIKGRGVRLAIGHGSRGLLLAAKLLRIPSLTLYDYEGASVAPFNRLSTYVMTPEVIPFATLEKLGLSKEKHRTYPGLKEEVYASQFTPSDRVVRELGLDPSKIIVTVRPPSATAHYRSDESFRLFDEIMQILAARQDVQIVLMPRNREQRKVLASQYHSKVIIPNAAVDGLDLLYHSDLVIGGGGTMNREAAGLGVPVATIFKGPLGAVDDWLLREGRMIAIDSVDQIQPLLTKRNAGTPSSFRGNTRAIIVRTILEILGRPQDQDEAAK